MFNQLQVGFFLPVFITLFIMYELIINDGLIQAVDPLIGGAVIGGLGSVIGGLFGSKSNSNTNRQNLQIARETNALNKELFFANQAWNEEMWNKQNEYNTPAVQAQRMLDAGFNPYLSDIDTGSASSVSPVSAPTMQGATMQSNADIIQNTFSNIAKQVGDYYYQSELQKAQIDGIKAQNKNTELKNQYDAASLLDRLSEQAGRARDFHTKANLQQLEKYYLEDTFTTRMNQEKAQLQSTLIRNYGDTLQNKIFEITHKYLEPQKVAELLQASANIDLTNANIRLVFANVVKSSLESEGIRLNNQQLRETMDFLINIKKVESQNMSDYGSPYAPSSRFKGIADTIDRFDNDYLHGYLKKGIHGFVDLITGN